LNSQNTSNWRGENAHQTQRLAAAPAQQVKRHRVPSYKRRATGMAVRALHGRCVQWVVIKSVRGAAAALAPQRSPGMGSGGRMVTCCGQPPFSLSLGIRRGIVAASSSSRKLSAKSVA
jgi:hypothetical protein